MVSSNIPPKKLWLELDNSKIDFEDKQQINIILNYIPESYELLDDQLILRTNSEADWMLFEPYVFVPSF